LQNSSKMLYTDPMTAVEFLKGPPLPSILSAVIWNYFLIIGETCVLLYLKPINIFHL